MTTHGIKMSCGCDACSSVRRDLAAAARTGEQIAEYQQMANEQEQRAIRAEARATEAFAERDSYQQNATAWEAQCMAAERDANEQRQRAEKAEAEVARLRETLEGLLGNIEAHRDGECPGRVAADCLGAIFGEAKWARHALTPRPSTATGEAASKEGATEK